MKKDTTLAKLLLPYSKNRLWVILSLDKEKVIGSGKTIKEAMEDTKSKNIKADDLTIIQAIPDYSGLASVFK